MSKINSKTKKFSKKNNLQKGRLGLKNQLKLIPASSIIYNNLVKPIKKIIAIAAIKPTVRPPTGITLANRTNPNTIDTITINPPLETAIEQRRSTIREESRLIPNEFTVLLPQEFYDSDAETVIVETEVEIIALE